MELVLEAEPALEAVAICSTYLVVATIAQFDWHLNYGSVLSFSEIGLSSKLQFCHSELMGSTGSAGKICYFCYLRWGYITYILTAAAATVL